MLLLLSMMPRCRECSTYNMRGELKSFNGTTKALFEPVRDNITTDKIINAKTPLLSAISTGWDIGSITLTLDADGGCYLLVATTRTIEGVDGGPNIIEPMEFYINID